MLSSCTDASNICALERCAAASSTLLAGARDLGKDCEWWRSDQIRARPRGSRHLNCEVRLHSDLVETLRVHHVARLFRTEQSLCVVTLFAGVPSH